MVIRFFFYRHLVEFQPQKRGASFFFKGDVNTLKPTFPLALMPLPSVFVRHGFSCFFGYYYHEHHPECSCDLFACDVDFVRRCPRYIRKIRRSDVELLSLLAPLGPYDDDKSRKKVYDSGYVQIHSKKKSRVIV